MARDTQHSWLICYDITSPKRLGRIHRFLCQQAIPIQYSVFLAEMTLTERDELLLELEQRIQAETDDIRCYPLPRHTELHHLGRCPLAGQDSFLLLLQHTQIS